MTPSRTTLERFLFVAPIVLVMLISVVGYVFITPETIVQYIGIENAYLLMFVAAFLGGLTTLNTVPYYSVLLLLATAGLNPLFVGLSSAVGVMCGDSVSYLIGRQGAVVVPTSLRTFFERIRVIATEHPRLFPLVCFVYGSLSPFSNDFITISAGLARIPYLRVMIPLALGNIVFNVSLAYLAIYAYTFVHALLY